MKPEWTARAYRELRNLEQYITGENSAEVAWKIVERILESVDLLESNPYLGRQAKRRGCRELLVGQYVILYSLHRTVEQDSASS